MSARTPHVFISYARSDGEEFAKDLRMKLKAENIPLWQDRVSMEGGRKWWLQIVEALDQVEYMVLVMTPAALQSATVRKEWRYARQQGVCVYPVKSQPDLDLSTLPRWMRDRHFYDLDHDHDWQKFINDLKTSCKKTYVPFMVEDRPADFVQRPTEFKQLIGKLLDDKREEPIAITAALRGTGGYGKTTMAKALCHDERIQSAFDDGILWVTLGENPANLLGKMEDLIYILSKERPGFVGIEAAITRFMALLEDRDILLVIDDVWDAADLKPFLQGGERCARLICTRDAKVLPFDAQRIPLGAMRQNEAVRLLSAGFNNAIDIENNSHKLYELASRLGEWPLLLKLVNARLRDRVNDNHQLLSDALSYVNRALDKSGLTTFDDQNEAVGKTLEVSFELLGEEKLDRYKELAIFPKDVDIPLAILQRLWNTTGGLDDLETEELCERLFSLSLLLNLDFTTRTIRLHDVISTYLQQKNRSKLANLHSLLLDTYKLERWAELPRNESYMWDHLAFHLIEAGRAKSLITTVKDLDYIAMKTYFRKVRATEADLILAEQEDSADTVLHALRSSIASMDYLLNSCKNLDEIKSVLHSRLTHQDTLSTLCGQLEQGLSRPFITSWCPLPDLPDPALIRTLQGHLEKIRACAVSPRGDYIVSASEDGDLESGILKVWDAQTGIERLTLYGHTYAVLSCAVSPNGDYIVSASKDGNLESGILKVWDAQTGEVLLALEGHSGAVNCCAVSPKGDYIVSGSDDRTLKVWNVQTGEAMLTLDGHTDVVRGCAISPKGDYIVSASDDGTLKIWDAQTGEVRLTLQGHTGWVTACAVSPKGDYIVSASWDKTLKIWDAQTGEVRLTLNGHSEVVTGCAISPKGDYIVSASYDKTVKVWDIQTGTERSTLYGHRSSVIGCAISPKGDWIVSSSFDLTLKMWNVPTVIKRLKTFEHIESVKGCVVSPNEDYVFSASDDKTLKIWDAQTGKELLTLHGHKGQVNGCAVSPEGDWIVSASADGSLKIWDVKTGKEQLTLYGHKDEVNGCAVSPSGDWVVSASEDESLKIWDAQTGETHLNLEGHVNAVNGCAVSPEGDWIVSASADESLKIWDVQAGEARLTLYGHSSGVNGCAVNQSGDWIVSASRDKTLKIWDAHTGEVRLTLDGHTGAVNGCVVSPKGKYILSVSGDRTLKVWDVHAGTCSATLHVDGDLWGCAFYPDGEHIVAGGERGLYFLRLVQQQVP